jgi:hypothetical protein
LPQPSAWQLYDPGKLGGQLDPHGWQEKTYGHDVLFALHASAPQSEQAAPFDPHSSRFEPLTHWPSEVQQPSHVVGPQV